ncbi:MAG: flagellar basal-body MS-ring/collar protein FliF [Terriglobia bacterium]
MPIDQKQALVQVTNFYRGLRPRQRYLLAASGVAVIGTLWLFVSLLGRGGYTPLYSGLSADDVQTITQRLAAENIPFQVSSDRTTLSVPAGKAGKVRLQMAAQGLPTAGRAGFELFDKPDWAGSDFYEKVNYQRALEGEIERTIEQLGDVQQARVNLVLPHDSLFTEQERPAKASVVVKLRGERLSEQSFRSITYLVASAVDGLKPENVTVVDANGGTPIAYRGGQQPWSAAGSKLETQLEEKINAMLAPVVGTDHVRSTVTIDYDTAASDITQDTYDPNGSVVLTSQTTYESDGSGAPGGVPGTTSNVPQGQPAPAKAAAPAKSNNATTAKTNAAATPAGKSATAAAAPAANAMTANNYTDLGSDAEKSDSKTYAVSHTVRHSIQPAGNIQRISAVVLVDDASETQGAGKHKKIVRQPLSAAEMSQIQDIAKAAIGFNSTRGDQVAVENIAFTSTPEMTTPPPTLVQKVMMQANQFMGLLRYVGLGLLFLAIYLLVIRPLMKPLLASFQAGPRAIPPSGQRALEPGAAAELQEEEDLRRAILSAPPAEDNAPTPDQVLASRLALAEGIQKNPEQASRLLGDWLIEEEGA